MVIILTKEILKFGILNRASDTFSVASQNIKLKDIKKTTLKHSTTMNGCLTQITWR